MAQDLNVVARMVDGGITVLDIVGDLDVTTLSVLSLRMEGFTRVSGAKLLMNCGRLGYINSMALGFLVQKMRKVERGGGFLGLCSLTQYNNTVMKLSGISKRMPIFDTEEEAIRALSSRQ